MPDSLEQSGPQPGADLAGEIQAHLGTPSKFANGKTRNWSLFVFFRIMSKSDVDNSNRLLAKTLVALSGADKKKHADPDCDFGAPIVGSYDPPANSGAAASADLSAPEPFDPEEDIYASEEFRAWLALLSKGDPKRLKDSYKSFLALAGKQPPDEKGQKLAKALMTALGGKDGLFGAVAMVQQSLAANLHDEKALVSMIQAIAGMLKKPPAKLSAALGAVLDLSAFGPDAGKAGEAVIAHRLVAVCAYELLRQFKLAGEVAKRRARAASDDGAVRTELDETGRAAQGHEKTAQANGYDSVPINIAFTHSGLKTLEIDENTLRSFPDVFKQGMAARARRLGDTGASAPENWEGELGLGSVHGYFTGGFQVGNLSGDGAWNMGPEASWAGLRQDIDDFNNRTGARGRTLRRLLGLLFRLVGMEVVHIELGQDPYRVENGMAVLSGYRKEHFGFRDGISQPFVDMKLGKPMRGGATPGRNGTWAPVAPGEIYLGYPDADGVTAKQPANDTLRKGGTFLVFRKLEQDVAGFQSFLAKQRPGDSAAQEKLAAQFMGRWKDGTPLTLAPDSPDSFGPGKEHLINDYLYAKDDPYGEKCPLGSHARRCNPRDIGGRNSVRRNRILRRGIGYGGPLLEDGSPADGNKRGLLFIAANARIDLQFEVIQADWMNRGEFLGQAGLGRCPIAGANAGRPEDGFYEAGANAPITSIPSFVTTRGGDYFFAPGRTALCGLSESRKFKPNDADMLAEGHSMGDARTPGVFTEARGREIADMFLEEDSSVQLVRVKMPKMPVASPYNDGATLHEQQGLDSNVCFLGRHAHVSKVLKLVSDEGEREFSAEHYSNAGKRVTRGDDILIGTEDCPPTKDRRERLYTILEAAWLALDTAWRGRNKQGVRRRLDDIVSGRLDAAIDRTGDSGRIDLVRDLACDASYGVVCDLFGTPGPEWISELGIALPFARQHVGHLHPEWLAALSGKAPKNPGLATMQIWSILTLGDVFGNVISYRPLMKLSAQAGGEMINHLNTQLSDAWTRRPGEISTLLEAFVQIEADMLEKFEDKGYDRSSYHADVVAILFELIASAMAAIPGTFGNVMDTVLRFRIDLPTLFSRMNKMNVPVREKFGKYDAALVTRLIYEAERMRPNFKVLMRRCVKDTSLQEGVEIKADEWVAALVAAANFDAHAFKDPYRFSLHPFVPDHPKRPMENYLLFGAAKSAPGTGQDLSSRVRARHCWGRDAVALHVLEQSVMAAARLEGLRRLAGEAGEVQDIAGAATGLWGRFNNVLPDFD